MSQRLPPLPYFISVDCRTTPATNQRQVFPAKHPGASVIPLIVGIGRSSCRTVGR